MYEMWQNLVINVLELSDCIADNISVHFVNQINSRNLKMIIGFNRKPIQIHIFHLLSGIQPDRPNILL